MRKGYGKGLGQGYKNLMPMDSHIHSLSAKGMKSLNARYVPFKKSKEIRFFSVYDPSKSRSSN